MVYGIAVLTKQHWSELSPNILWCGREVGELISIALVKVTSALWKMKMREMKELDARIALLTHASTI